MKNKITLFVVFLIFMVLVSGILCNSLEKEKPPIKPFLKPSQQTVNLPILKLTPEMARERICKIPDMAFSPDGQMVLSGIDMIETNCLFSTNNQQSCRSATIWAPNRKKFIFEPNHIAWSQNGKSLIVAESLGYRYSLKPSFQSKLSQNEEPYNSYTRHKIIYDGLLPEAHNFDAKKIKSSLIKNMKKLETPWSRHSTFYRHYITNGQYIGSIAVDLKTGKVFYFNPVKEIIIDTHANYKVVKNIYLITTNTGSPIVLLDGVPLPLDAANENDAWLKAIKPTIYPRAIIDTEQHRMIGWTSIERFALDTNTLQEKEFQRLNLLLSKIYKTRTFNHISTIEYLARVDKLRIDGVDQSRRFIRRIYEISNSDKIDQKESSSIKCLNNKLIFENKANLDDSNKSTIYKIGADSTSIPVLDIRRHSKYPKKTLVLYMPGGPGATVIKPKYAGNILKIFPLDAHDIIMFDYSGAKGASLESARRLVNNKEKALETDIEIIGNFINTIDRTKYKQIVLVSSSFSGLMAMQIANDHPTFIDQLILIVPWTHHLSLRKMKEKDPKTFAFLFSGTRKQISDGLKLLIELFWVLTKSQKQITLEIGWLKREIIFSQKCLCLFLKQNGKTE